MSESIIANWNAKNCLLSELLIPVEDRAFFFADAVYEVISVYHSRAFLFDEHLARLKRSMKALELVSSIDFRSLINNNIKANQISHGMVYLQVSRGTTARMHSFNDLTIQPNILVYAKSAAQLTSETDFNQGISAITHEDQRWSRCDIKSTNLIANCMAQTTAIKRGAKEAILIRHGLGVTEGSSSNIFMVKNKRFITPPLSNYILAGTVREHLLKLLNTHGHAYEERSITQDELYTADELFITSTTREALGVIKLDNRAVGKGQIGPCTKLARKLIIESVDKS